MHLKEYLSRNRISCQELAEILGLSRNCVIRYVEGEVSPKLITALKINWYTKGVVSIMDLVVEKDIELLKFLKEEDMAKEHLEALRQKEKSPYYYV